MKPNIVLLLLCLTMLFVGQTFSQGRESRQRTQAYTNPGEIVTFDSTMTFDVVLNALNKLSMQYAGKFIIDPLRRKHQIGVFVPPQHWRDALDLILIASGLWYIEEEKYILIEPKEGAPPKLIQEGKQVKRFPGLESRQVRISTIVVGINVAKLIEYGIDWTFSFLDPSPRRLAGVKDTLSVSGALEAFKGADVFVERPFQGGSISSILNFLSSNNLGDVINSVKMVIPEGDSGVVQIGQDISIPTRDISAAGTTVSATLIPTGTVLKVKPYILKAEEVEYVYLEFDFSQSSLLSGGELPIINKNAAKQSLLALHGDEISTSAYYTYNELNERVGIPILKDLPWWFFGLRYIFGSERTTINKTQIIYLLKIEILPSLRERATMMQRESDLEMMRNRMDTEIDRLKTKEN